MDAGGTLAVAGGAKRRRPITRRATVIAKLMSKWSVHLCPDREDLEWMPGGRPWCHWGRVHLNSPWFHFALALTPGWRFTWMRGPAPARYRGRGTKVRWTDVRMR